MHDGPGLTWFGSDRYSGEDVRGVSCLVRKYRVSSVIGTKRARHASLIPFSFDLDSCTSGFLR